MSYIIISVKNRQNDFIKSTTLKMNTCNDMEQAASEQLPKSIACLGILMALRSRDEEGCGVEVLEPDRSSTSMVRRRFSRRPNDKSTRLVILAVGLDERIYPCLESTDLEERKEIKGIMKSLLDLQRGIKLSYDSYGRNMAVGYQKH
jgi:hypothetical protein